MVIISYYVRDFFIMIGDLVKHIADLIISVFSLIGEFFSTAVDIVGVLPSIFITIGVVSIIVTILFKILGRKSSEE